jgi:Fungal specific transcription factor domain
MVPFWGVQADDHSSVSTFTRLANLELFKRRLQMSKNLAVDFDEVLPFYRQSYNDGTSDDDADLTDSNTSFALPSKSSAEKLVHSFFTAWHVLFPVLHRPSFQWDFEAMYTEKASKDPAHFAQMWLVLAIGARDAAVMVSVSMLSLTTGSGCT